MDSFEFNKLAGGVLGTLLFVVALSLIGDFIFDRGEPAKPGYPLPATAPAAAPAAGTAAAAAPAAATAAAAPSLPTLLAAADPAKGEQDAQICGVCHTFNEGGGVKIGPPLYGVVGRPVASVAGFDYSDALKAKGGDWTFDKINTWITDPKAYAPGTKMSFAGESSPERRADIIAYLRTLSASPVPLPAVAEAAPTAAETPPASAPAAAATTASNGGAGAPTVDLPKLLAAADPAKGEQDTQICGVCHTFNEGGGVKIGPPLYGVVGRPVASVAGFDYSDALKAKGGDWTFDKLNTWITDPKAYAPGTKMSFSGESSPTRRADIIAYLRTLSASPVPLPAVAEAAAPTAAAETPPASAPAAAATTASNGGAGAPTDDLSKLLAAADPAKGEQDTQICGICHTFNEGGGVKIGPPLYGVVGRPVASVAGFDYSDALKAKGGDWTFDKLNTWITDPKAYAPGTKMSFAGESSPTRRADIIAYLRTLSPSPVPLPQ